MVDAPPDRRTAAEWVAGFAAGWAEASDAESFCDHFDRLLADDIRLIQPQLPTTVGKRAFRQRFARPLFELLGEVRGTVGSWAASGDVVFIELTIRGRLGSRPVELRSVDKVTLRDGVAVERVANLDPLPLLGAVAVTPRAWPSIARVQFARLVRR
jgi:SnoaL-like domain